MTFDHLLFLFSFLPALLLVHAVTPAKYRQRVLIVASLFFYLLASPEFLLLFIFSLLLNSLFGWIILNQQTSRRVSRLCLFTGVLFNVGMLALYKYWNFAASNFSRITGIGIATQTLLLPLGLSFFTFKAISYLADAYKGEITSFRLEQTVLYLSFFGQIQSGPIARYETFAPVKRVESSLFNAGCVRFMIGFSKKVLIADVLYNIVTEVFDTTGMQSTSMVWLASVCYSLQLFYDFSGYSDMAIGICSMFGYPCPENFNYPYMTKSLSEFWRRWHITLGVWFRNYIYIPMGGARFPRLRLYLNLLTVWALTGIWHGANWNFVVWGLVYFVLLALEKTLNIPKRLNGWMPRTLYRCIILLIINFQWVVFRSSDLTTGLQMLKSMVVYTGDAASNARTLFLLQDYGAFLLIAVIFCMPVVQWINSVCQKSKAANTAYQIVFGCTVCAAFIAALSFVVSGQSNPFLYGNF